MLRPFAEGPARVRASGWRGQPGRPARLDHGPRRHRRRERARFGRLRRRCRGGGGQTPQCPGRRPVRGKAPHRGHPRAAGQTPGARYPGPRRRRPHVRHQRNGVARRGGHGRERRSCAAPRARAGALRGHDQREPGTHAGHSHPGGPRFGARSVRAMGSAGHGRGQSHEHEAVADPQRMGRRGVGGRPGGQPA